MCPCIDRMLPQQSHFQTFLQDSRTICKRHQTTPPPEGQVPRRSQVQRPFVGFPRSFTRPRAKLPLLHVVHARLQMAQSQQRRTRNTRYACTRDCETACSHTPIRRSPTLGRVRRSPGSRQQGAAKSATGQVRLPGFPESLDCLPRSAERHVPFGD